MNLGTDIKYVKGVGDVMRSRFEKIGVTTVEQLLYHFPREYEDWSNPTPIAETEPEKTYCVKGRVIAPPAAQRTKNGSIYKALVSDGRGLLETVFFNNKYIVKSLPDGGEFLFYGKLTLNEHTGARQMLSPAYAPVGKSQRLRPVYRRTEGLTSKKIESTVENALDAMRGSFEETLPEYMLVKYGFPPLEKALRNIHLPETPDDAQKARDRFIFEELLELQLGLLMLRTRRRAKTACVVKNDFTGEFIGSLPFEMTGAQLRCVREAVNDMRSDEPMNRLLQGDVGSGKTAVAAALIYNAAKNGYQSALMAPTEILATQHLETMKSFFGEDFPVALLTGSTKAAEKRKILAGLASGGIKLAIGTHALISGGVEFDNLGLVITDEQHRFGVRQRAALASKAREPHTLVMSATPIPRTLGLIVYGDLDISVIDEMPRGRKPVKTYAVTSDYHERIYKYIRKFVSAGRQVYVVCPLVEESEAAELVPASELYEYLRDKIFPDLRMGLLHGRMKPKEKDAVMRAFAAGEIDVLVSTVVIEVGINVPNACLMVVENAERFGLSQLHQLRGRIGRGAEESVCVLISDASNREAQTRLKTMTRTNDGFEIAQEDLKLRGPGDFLGERQHGLPSFKIADIATDSRMLYTARDQALSIYEADPELSLPEHRRLREKTQTLFDTFSGSIN